jgi:hypothetical protein
MDAERLQQELDLLRMAYPDLEHTVVADVHWVRIPSYPVPAGWSHPQVQVACQIPPSAGQAPYGFFVKPALRLSNGGVPSNYTASAATPWGGDWSMFSWSPLDNWVPKADISAGANMLNFVRSFADRLREAS